MYTNKPKIEQNTNTKTESAFYYFFKVKQITDSIEFAKYLIDRTYVG